jgi:signal transduction histidine kinase
LAISSSAPKPVVVLSLDRLARHVAQLSPAARIPILVVRMRRLKHVAWRQGRQAARLLERQYVQSFTDVTSRVLRREDLIAHDRGSEYFVAALLAPARSNGLSAVPADCRTTLARLASAMESTAEIQAESGWTIVAGASLDFDLPAAIDAALERGAYERAHSDFFGTLAHELRTPLTSIRGYLETLSEESLDRETMQRFLRTAQAEALRMERLLDGLFDSALLEVRVPVLEQQGSQLDEAVDAAIATIAPMATAKRTVISLLICDRRTVVLGKDQLTQVLVNVLENAVKHGRDAGRIFIVAFDAGDRFAEIRVDDDGQGVPVEERDSIFAAARRGKRAQGEGRGLGLAVVRLLIDRVGGSVEVGDSRFGGASFTIRLPLVDVEAPPPAA